jgi:hypothetical protein
MTTPPSKIGAIIIILFIVEVALFAGLLFHDRFQTAQERRLQDEAAVMQKLQLTDLCLATESRHTRNIALPELMAPFQDMPGYHDHFPSSTFLKPPTRYEGFSR